MAEIARLKEELKDQRERNKALQAVTEELRELLEPVKARVVFMESVIINVGVAMQDAMDQRASLTEANRGLRESNQSLKEELLRCHGVLKEFEERNTRLAEEVRQKFLQQEGYHDVAVRKLADYAERDQELERLISEQEELLARQEVRLALCVCQSEE